MSAAAKQVRRDVAIPTAAEFRTRVREAVIAVESALAAAEALAAHGITESVSYDRMIDFLSEAAEALDLLAAALEPAPPSTIFPNRALALAYIEQHPLSDPEMTYRICPDGAGRCSVALYRIVGHL